MTKQAGNTCGDGGIFAVLFSVNIHQQIHHVGAPHDVQASLVQSLVIVHLTTALKNVM